MKKLTRRPKITINEIFRALIFPVFNNNSRAQNYWKERGQNAWLITRSTWSIILIILLYKRKFERQTINLWLPSYYCESTIGPIRRLNVNITFYDVNEFFKPQRETLLKLLKEKRPDIIILVHYFCLSPDFNEISNLLKDIETWIIEDATQCFLPIDRIGTFGHFILFSPYKFLPIPYGAVLVETNKGQESQLDDKLFNELLVEIVESFPNLIQNSLNQYLNQVKWIIKQFLVWVKIPVKYNVRFESVVAESSMIENPKVGSFYRSLINILMKNAKEIKDRRQNNLKILINALKNNNYNLLINTGILNTLNANLANNTVLPITFPIMFKNEEDAERVFYRFIQRGVQVNIWPDLPKEVLGNDYETANKLRNTIVHFPIHQSILLKRNETEQLLNEIFNLGKL